MSLTDEDVAEAVELFRDLLRIDTTNPPGDERPAAELLADYLADAGFDPWIVESEVDRANLVVRLPATVDEPTGGPLMLAGHTDVVPADASEWTQPPFEAVRADGCIWGRGAVDMKNMVAMSAVVTALLRRRETERERDLIFAAVADEEEGCEHGSAFLVDEHPDRVRADYVLGEVGGFWQYVGGVLYVPVMVAEKGRAHLRLTARGPSGHASLPRSDAATVELARAIERLGRRRLPYHSTPPVRRFVEALAEAQPFASPTRAGLAGLRSPLLAETVIDRLLPDPEVARNFDALLHNTVAPTRLEAGGALNVLPSEAVCDLDGRMLPGFSGDDLRGEVEACLEGLAVDVEVVDEQPGVCAEEIDGPLFDTIRSAVSEHRTEAHPVPYMIPGYTDARHFSRLGATCYGFAPLAIPEETDIAFSEMFHGVDERVPVEGFEWGLRVLYDVVSTFLDPATS
ncbi:MAG: M20/M25/M40 family metallo-hydrolase [Bradymonadaceae bacterium]